MSKPPIVAVTGGKGGVGKTTVAVGLALAFVRRGLSVLLVDADVDNPNCHELLGVSVEKLADVTSFLPAIDESRCTGCGICVGICPDFALLIKPGEAPKVVESRCSGCMACSFACQVGAIIRSTKVLGELFTAARYNLRLIGGKLKPGEARSPLVVDALLKRAMAERGDYDVLVIDSAPGLGNAVVRALRVADLAVVVTKPTPLG
ncbi:MAG TPA: cobalamin biosynthesis protein CobQ, partial [Armatimonadetes bacterium]|nr:cobalamin biosynthesis protein CobQ [Armatimonadota bacterium]